jgi:MFS family permease
MTGLLELGAFLGALQAGYLADRFSRKMAIGEFFAVEIRDCRDSS